VRLTPATLLSHLEKGCDRAYLLFGPESLLVDEACARLRQVARTQGVDEILRFTAGVDLDWQQLYESTRSLALFASRRMIEIRLPTGKPGTTGAKTLISLLEENRDDMILLVVAGRIDKRTQAANWFKMLERTGAVVEAAAVPTGKLPRWIEARLLAQGLRPESGVAKRLAFYVEGNLRAAAQEIDKLALLLPPGQVLNVAMLERSISDQARFSVYQFVDSCLQGVFERALRILTTLRRDGTEPVLVIWALAREARQLAEMAAQIDGGQSRQTVFRRHQVWSTRSTCVGAALGRHKGTYWRYLLAHLAEIDQVAKGRSATVGSPWAHLERVVLSICGINTGSGLPS
jgi:DNA polymerase-3 subunit delta